MSKLKQFIVGIDPGKNTGIGIIKRASGMEQRDTVLAWATHSFITTKPYLDAIFADKGEVKIFIELPPEFVYNRNAKTDEPAHVTARRNQMIASNRTEAKLLFELLNSEKWDVELVAPVREPKWDDRKFRLMTGKAGSTNQHCRDAVRLAIYYANKRRLGK